MSHRILFVDDCSTTLLLEQMRFAGRTDYNLELARDGRDAIQKAVREQPNLILMDATPQNIESCREMRQIEKLKRVPILLVCSAVETPAAETSPANYANDDQTSPFMWKGLVEMVDTYLASGRPLRSTR